VADRQDRPVFASGTKGVEHGLLGHRIQPGRRLVQQ
jgi:hypothetical protein